MKNTRVRFALEESDEEDSDDNRSDVGDAGSDSSEGERSSQKSSGSRKSSRSRRYDAVSVVSSVRTVEQQIIDEKFDRVLDEYIDEEIGSLDEGELVEGGLRDISEFEDVLDDFIREHIDSVLDLDDESDSETDEVRVGRFNLLALL